MFTPPRRLLQDTSNIQSNSQIRVVPYSPPRLSSDYPVTSSPEQHHPPEASGAASSLVSLPGYYTTDTTPDTDRRPLSTPRRLSSSSSTRRLRHIVNVHADKTFSLLPQGGRESNSFCSNSFLDSTAVNSVIGQDSSVTLGDYRQSSIQPVQSQNTPNRLTRYAATDPFSPCSFEFVGGLRKVYQQTPESGCPDAISHTVSPSLNETLSSADKHVSLPTRQLIPRKPVPSSHGPSPGNSSEANYTILRQTKPNKTIDRQSSPEFDTLSPLRQDNYRIFGDSASQGHSLDSCSRLGTSDSEPNYIRHDGYSPSVIVDPPAIRLLKPEFSRESLVVAPLRTARKLFTRKTVPDQLPSAKGKNRDNDPSDSRLVKDQDEHGDGLANLCGPLNHRSVRGRGIAEMMVSGYASDRKLRSSASTRTTNWVIPTWARLYYGRGERQFLTHQASLESIKSAHTDSSGGSSLPVCSPSMERLGRPPQTQPENWRTDGGWSPAAVKRPYPDLAWARTLKKQTSSLWSPHLRRDKRRASSTARGIWRPPAGALSCAVGGVTSPRRNVQVLLFLSGFLLPVAWMVAAFLPLPANRGLAGKDLLSTSHIDLAAENDGARSPSRLAAETRLYNCAKWWRDVNRAMAIVGLVIIGTFAVLITLGARPHQWR